MLGRLAAELVGEEWRSLMGCVEWRDAENRLLEVGAGVAVSRWGVFLLAPIRPVCGRVIRSNNLGSIRILANQLFS